MYNQGGNEKTTQSNVLQHQGEQTEEELSISTGRKSCEKAIYRKYPINTRLIGQLTDTLLTRNFHGNQAVNFSTPSYQSLGSSVERVVGIVTIPTVSWPGRFCPGKVTPPLACIRHVHFGYCYIHTQKFKLFLVTPGNVLKIFARFKWSSSRSQCPGLC